jgi:hypothetical protein
VREGVRRELRDDQLRVVEPILVQAVAEPLADDHPSARADERRPGQVIVVGGDQGTPPMPIRAGQETCAGRDDLGPLCPTFRIVGLRRGIEPSNAVRLTNERVATLPPQPEGIGMIDGRANEEAPMSTDPKDMSKEIEDLKSAQAAQAATQVGQMATFTAMNAGTVGAIVAGAAGLTAGMLLGLLVAVVSRGNRR